MHDNAISLSKLITAALWAWVALLFAAAWGTWLWHDSDIWMMLAFTGCASSALAATAQIRCYSLRICGLLRATAGTSPADVHSLR
jgi:hypothetical protein